MESLCTSCNKTETKYSCIDCDLPVWNKCSTAADETVIGYSKELKRVSKYPDCVTDFVSDSPDISV